MLFALDGCQDPAAEAAHLSEEQPAARIKREVRAVCGQPSAKHDCESPRQVPAIRRGAEQEDVGPALADHTRRRVGVRLSRELGQQRVQDVDHPVKVEVGRPLGKIVELVANEEARQLGSRLA